MERNVEKQLAQVVERHRNNNDIEQLISGYKICAKTEGKSPGTLTTYVTAFKRFVHFLKANKCCHDVTEISTKVIRDYILYLQQSKTFLQHPFTGPQNKTLEGHSINCYLRALGAFWSWLVREEIVQSNPFSKIVIPKPPKKIIPAFSDTQIQTLLRGISTNYKIGFRDYTIVLILLDTGIRASELACLTLDDINLCK